MELFEKIRGIVSEQFGVEPETLTEDTDFIDELGADSLDVVELAVSMEDEFGVPEIGEEELRRIRTLGDLVDYVRRVLD